MSTRLIDIKQRRRARQRQQKNAGQGKEVAAAEVMTSVVDEAETAAAAVVSAASPSELTPVDGTTSATEETVVSESSSATDSVVSEVEDVTAASESSPSTVDGTKPLSLEQRLHQANQEITRLKQVIAKQTNNGVSISYPMPAITGAGLLDVDQFEMVKTLYSGLIIELIKTTHAELERNNRKAYGLYNIDEVKKEVTITLAETTDL